MEFPVASTPGQLLGIPPGGRSIRLNPWVGRNVSEQVAAAP